MHRDNFWLDGEDAAAMGVLLLQELQFDAAEPSVSAVNVPGRDGALHYYDGSYKNVRGRARCCCLGEPVAERMSEVNAWLLRRQGYRRLQALTEPHFYRLARIVRGAALSPHRDSYNEFEIEFDCRPFRYFLDGERAVSFTAAGDLRGPTTFPSLPLITVHGSGAGTVTINGATLTLTDCDEITLDCETMDASRSGANLNSAVSGTYPTLGQINSISFTGGVTGLTITPRWRTI